MKQRLFIKGITLAGFVVLISFFLMYRMGKLNSYFFDEEPAMQTSPNGGKIATGTPNADSTKPLRMSSSKSMILTEKNPLNASDKGAEVISPKNTNPDRSNRARMSGSKSLVMLDNDPIITEHKKRADSNYMLTYRFNYFQDSMRKVSKPLPRSLQIMIDTMKFNYRSINWFYPK